MFSLNRATIIGNATKDPEMRYTPNGQAVTSFSIATNRRWTDRNTGETQESVEFHEIVAWGKLAENISQFVKKGQPVYAEGRLQTRSWEGQDGAKRQKTEIVANNIIALGRRGEGSHSSVSDDSSSDKQDNPVEKISKPKKKSSKDSDKEETEEIDIDEIPF